MMENLLASTCIREKLTLMTLAFVQISQTIMFNAPAVV